MDAEGREQAGEELPQQRLGDATVPLSARLHHPQGNHDCRIGPGLRVPTSDAVGCRTVAGFYRSASASSGAASRG